jgi:hypothetical protein
MSLHSWLHNLRSGLAARRRQRDHARRGSKRTPTHRPSLEALEGRLTPSFSPATSFSVGPNPQAVVTADFNNDGRLDLATANYGDGTVSVLLGDGRGGFGAANHFDVGGGALTRSRLPTSTRTANSIWPRTLRATWPCCWAMAMAPSEHPPTST